MTVYIFNCSQYYTVQHTRLCSRKLVTSN